MNSIELFISLLKFYFRLLVSVFFFSLSQSLGKISHYSFSTFVSLLIYGNKLPFVCHYLHFIFVPSEYFILKESVQFNFVQNFFLVSSKSFSSFPVKVFYPQNILESNYFGNFPYICPHTFYMLFYMFFFFHFLIFYNFFFWIKSIYFWHKKIEAKYDSFISSFIYGIPFIDFWFDP